MNKCICGLELPSYKYLVHHLRCERMLAKKAGIPNTHKKIRAISYSEATIKGITKRQELRARRMAFLNGG